MTEKAKAKTVADVLAEMRSFGESGNVAVPLDLNAWADRIERAMAASAVPDGFRIEVQYATEQWITTAYTLVAPDHRRWSPAPGEPGYALLCALSATTPEESP